MKKLKSVVRVVAQLVIAGPIIAYFPFAIWIGVGSIVLAFHDGITEPHKTVAYSLGWIGLIGLYASILIPVGFFRRHRTARWILISFLACGFVTTAVMLFGPGGIYERPEYFHVWFFGGPMFVALWNIGRALDEEPNKSPEPTSCTVMPRATE